MHLRVAQNQARNEIKTQSIKRCRYGNALDVALKPSQVFLNRAATPVATQMARSCRKAASRNNSHRCALLC